MVTLTGYDIAVIVGVIFPILLLIPELCNNLYKIFKSKNWSEGLKWLWLINLLAVEGSLILWVILPFSQGINIGLPSGDQVDALTNWALLYDFWLVMLYFFDLNVTLTYYATKRKLIRWFE